MHAPGHIGLERALPLGLGMGAAGEWPRCFSRMTAGTIQGPQASSEVCTWTFVEVLRWSDTKRARSGHDSLTFLNLHMAHRATLALLKLYTVHQHSMR